MSVVILLGLFSFETKKIGDYISNTLRQAEMHVINIQDIPSSGKRGFLINGLLVGGEEVYFGLNGTDQIDFFEYYNEIPPDVRMKSNFKDISSLDLKIPIVKFESSNNVLLIKKGSNFKKTITQWLRPIIILLVISILPFLIYPIIKKYY